MDIKNLIVAVVRRLDVFTPGSAGADLSDVIEACADHPTCAQLEAAEEHLEKAVDIMIRSFVALGGQYSNDLPRVMREFIGEDRAAKCTTSAAPVPALPGETFAEYAARVDPAGLALLAAPPDCIWASFGAKGGCWVDLSLVRYALKPTREAGK